APELAVNVNGVEVGYGFNEAYCYDQIFSIDFGGVTPGILPLQTLEWSITEDGDSFMSGTDTAIPQNIFSGTAEPGVYVFSLNAFVDGNGCTLPNRGAYTATITVQEAPELAIEVNGEEVGFGFSATYCDIEMLIV